MISAVRIMGFGCTPIGRIQNIAVETKEVQQYQLCVCFVRPFAGCVRGIFLCFFLMWACLWFFLFLRCDWFVLRFSWFQFLPEVTKTENNAGKKFIWLILTCSIADWCIQFRRCTQGTNNARQEQVWATLLPLCFFFFCRVGCVRPGHEPRWRGPMLTVICPADRVVHGLQIWASAYD